MHHSYFRTDDFSPTYFEKVYRKVCFVVQGLKLQEIQFLVHLDSGPNYMEYDYNYMKKISPKNSVSIDFSRVITTFSGRHSVYE